MKFAMTTVPLILAAAAPLCADSQGTQPMSSSQQMNMITPSAEPAVTRCCDPFITADFIYWRAREEGLVYAVNGITNDLRG